MPNLKRNIEALSAERLRELEADWRSGLLTIAVLAAKYGLHRDALQRFAEKVGWRRGDLRAAIDSAATSALVRRAATDGDHACGAGTGLAPSDRETVARYGQIVAGVVESHQRDVARGRQHAAELARQLAWLTPVFVDEEATGGLASVIADQNSDLASALCPRPKRPTKEELQLFRERAEILKSIATTQRIYIELERQALGLDKPGAQEATYDDFLAEFYGEQQDKLDGR